MRRAKEGGPYHPPVMRSRGSRPVPTIAMLVVASLAAAVIAVRLPLDGFLWYFDVTKVSFPNASFFHEAVASGSLPLWVDELGLGFPLYAEGQVGAFYPPNAVLHLLPPHWAMEASRVVHLALAGVGAGLIALRLTGVERAMIVAAVATVLGGGIVAKLEWTNVVVAYGWLPWVLLPLVRRPTPTRLGLVAAGVAWGIQALAGHPNTWVMTGIAAAALLLAIAPRPATLGRLAVLGVTAVAVGAVQLLPTLQLWSLSARTEGLPDWDLFSNSATIFDALIPGFANAFMPLGPREWDFATQWYPGGLWGVHESSAYLGLPMLGLAAIGLTQRRARPFAAVAVALIAVAVLGAFRPTPWLETPILNGLRHPTRAYLFAAFALSIMAGIGVARLGRANPPWRPAAIAIGGSMALYALVANLASWWPSGFAALTGWAFGLTPEAAAATTASAARTLLRPLPLMIELGLGLATLALLAGVAGERRRRHVAPVVAALAVIVLALCSPTVNPVRPETEISQATTPYMRAVEAEAPSRFAALIDPSWYQGIPNQLAARGTAELGMFSSLNLRATDEVVTALRTEPVDTELARLLGIDVLATFGSDCPGDELAALAADGATICRIADAVTPPIWLPADAVGPGYVAAASSAASRVRGWFGIEVVDHDVDIPSAIARGIPAFIEARDDGRGVFTVEAPAAGWVWIDRAWWPDWQTTVNGNRLTADRALGGQLVEVAAGPNRIEQRFVPRAAWEGLLIGAVGLTFLVAWAMHGARQRVELPDHRRAS